MTVRLPNILFWQLFYLLILNERGMHYEKNKIYQDAFHVAGRHDDDDNDAS
jgi:hypothetical protein